jgi:hypothetical protein
MRSLLTTRVGRTSEIVACGALVLAMTAGSLGCATGGSAAAASTYGKASVYRSATAYVQLAPEQAFNPAVKMLLERGDIEITDLKEANNRCKAVTDDFKLTFRVIESGPGRSRLSMLVGGGNDPGANQELAERLMRAICGRLTVDCNPEPEAP